MAPRAGDRCFVPRAVWPRRAVTETPHGAGWLATVVAVDAREVRIRWDDGAERQGAGAAAHGAGTRRDDALAMPTFRRRCVLVAGTPPHGTWGRLDEDALSAVLGACRLADLLALEATHRGSLLLVRGFLQRHRWAHATLLRAAPGAVAAAGGRFVAVGAADPTGGACLQVWRDGAPAARHRTRRAITLVAVDAAMGTVAWSAATAVRRAPLHVAEAPGGEAHAYRPCFATALAWTARGMLLVAERGRVVEWRPGAPERVLLVRVDRAGAAVVDALAPSGCMALVGWDDGAVHAVHAPHAPLLHACPYHAGYEMRAPCGEATRAVALAAGVGAAALGSCVDVWSTNGAHRLRVGARATALGLHGGWLIVGAGAEGRLEVWEPSDARRVGALAGAGGAVQSLAVCEDGGIARCCAGAQGDVLVLHSRPPMRLS